ncbi:MAG: LysR family transcriptional regulator [Pseudomonadota bacterium]
MDQFLAMKVFVAVVDEESFGAAAKKLNLSRTAVSKNVMDLEAHLKARLMNRTTRRQSLTGTGYAYYQRAKFILNEIEEADAEATNQSRTPHGLLRVNAPMSFGILRIAPYLKAYLDRYPGVDIELTLNDRVVDLVDEGYDLAIRIGVLADSSLIARRIASSELLVCAAPAYLETQGIPEWPSDLAAHQCLTYSYLDRPDRWRFSRGSEDLTVRITPRLISNNGDALLTAAASSLGIILQPSFIVEAALEDGRLQRILAEFDAGELGIYAVYPSNRLISARVRTFIDYLRGCFAGR